MDMNCASQTTSPVLNLLLGVHAHQPVGNFPQVIADAHIRCYGMFIRTLYDYPQFRFAVHFSGWLLDELEARWPQDMALLAQMSARGQVEWFGSGDCEPVLAAIPHRDRLTQIKALSDKIAHRYGQRPQGAWLTERVWESSVVRALVEADIAYVAVDDYHFLCAGEPAQHLDGYFTTEDDGRVIDLFPISEQARYRLPFTPADQVIDWLEGLARQGQKALVYFDDIEKFGIWPQTYQWVYEQGWLRQFIEGVLASPYLRTDRFADFRGRSKTRGLVYLPTTSYIEMNEWTLPLDAARCFRNLQNQEKQAGRFDAHKPWLRGGIWRNFMQRYPEANWMHKRMLCASERLASLPAGENHNALRVFLHRAQANDAYWHGLFGGLYLPHLRRAVWHNLLRLEQALEPLLPRKDQERIDLDHDGCDEVFVRNAHWQAVWREDGHASVIELSSYDLAHNFTDTLRRIAESYHDKITQQHHHPDQSPDKGIASAHDMISFRHEISPQDLDPDTRPRTLFVDTWHSASAPAQPLDQYRSAAPCQYTASVREHLAVVKSFTLRNNSFSTHYQLHGTAQAGDALDIRLNLAMPSCDGFLGRYRLADGTIAGGFGCALDAGTSTQLTLEDGVLGGALRITTSQAVHLQARPHYTVSQSEAGFEKIMQATEILLIWSPCTQASDPQITITLDITADIAPCPAQTPEHSSLPPQQGSPA
jgi:hypothetical protein